MKRSLMLVASVLILVAALGCAQQQRRPEQAPPGAGPAVPPSQPEPEKAGRSVVHKLLLYVPNRVLDVFDVIRMRARVGPGLGVGVRATKVFSAYAGSYASIYGGLPGPRNGPCIKLPVGLESSTGITVSVADATVGGGIGPDYSFTEFGTSLHLFVLGFDVGMDPVEILDLLTGILFIDIKGDDL